MKNKIRTRQNAVEANQIDKRQLNSRKQDCLFATVRNGGGLIQTMETEINKIGLQRTFNLNPINKYFLSAILFSRNFNFIDFIL